MRTIGIGLVLALLTVSCVTDTVHDSPAQMVTVRGEVKKPGFYPLTAGMTVTDAIVAAEGYTDFASGILVIRGEERVVRVRGRDWKHHPEKWDIALQDGDVVVAQRLD